MNLSPVYLVDASVYIFRAWFSMPDEFTNRDGQPTNAAYGFSGFLCSLLEQTGAGHVAVAFDVSLSTGYRNEIYPEYKAPVNGADMYPKLGGNFSRWFTLIFIPS